MPFILTVVGTCVWAYGFIYLSHTGSMFWFTVGVVILVLACGWPHRTNRR